MTPEQMEGYLNRIGFTNRLEATATCLRRLHRQHLLTVPFENLSIHHGEAIELSEPALFEKIVTRRRGGFCYELNGLFAGLLRAAGFEVVMLAAEVARAGGGFGPLFDHMALLVTLEEPWLVDVGFGDSFLEPLRFDPGDVQPQATRAYRLSWVAPYWLMQQRDETTPWTTQFRFTLTPYPLAAFAGMCRFHQTSPDSHFTQKTVCSLATESGRVTVSGRQLIVTENGTRTEQTLPDDAAVAAALKTYFNVVI